MTETRTDAELMRHLAAGDREALAELFHRHHRNVYALCHRLCGGAAEAEDLTQEVFLRVLRHAGTFASRARFSTWLYRIARNTCLTAARTDQRESAKRERFAVEPPPEPASPQPGADAIARLRAALNRLEPDKREVLVLKRYQGLSYREIAEVCGCSVGAVRVRLHRALQALRQCYFELDELQVHPSPPDR